ncbi:hypothetical protein [Pseudobacillus badius]|nr:hypothetical protein [Bacillus badius]GLY12546.1 hypothetical protein Bbad01_37620 [Bacillus badius]
MYKAFLNIAEKTCDRAGKERLGKVKEEQNYFQQGSGTGLKE